MSTKGEWSEFIVKGRESGVSTKGEWSEFIVNSQVA